MLSRWWRYPRRRALALLMVALLLPAATPQVAHASCVSEAVESCDREFNTWYERLLGLRLLCYVVRIGVCELLEPPE